MATKKKETRLALIGKDVKVNNVVSALEKELTGLKTITESPYKTTGTPEGCNKSIKDMTSEAELVKAMSSILMRHKAYELAQDHLGLDTIPEFTISGYNLAAWTGDIKLRLNIIKYEERRKQLEELMNEAKSFMTKEDNYALFLQKLSSAISK